MRKISKVVAGIATVLMLCVAACAQSAPAGTTDIGVSVTAPTSCGSGEAIAISGTVHLEYTFSTDANGSNTYTVTGTSKATGTGQTTNAAYAGNGEFGFTFSAPDSPAQYATTIHYSISAPDQGVSLRLRQSLNVSVDNAGSISAAVSNVATECIDSAN